MTAKMNMDELQEFLQEKMECCSLEKTINQDENTIIISLNIDNDEPDIHNRICSFFQLLKEDSQLLFTQLMDITAVDYINYEQDHNYRFAVIYHLLSIKFAKRIRIKLFLDTNIVPPSLNKLYSNSTWYERELWDLYGIKCNNIVDERRILTDYGFEGHPLRKDFPLTGYTEIHYDEKEEKIKYAPVSLQQEYRNFDCLSPWEGMNNSSS